jgi:hypothetical protein
VSEIASTIRKTIQEAKAPVSLSALQKRTRVAPEELKRALSDELARHTIHRWPDFGAQKQRFWLRPPDEVVREQALAAASERAMPSSALAKQVRKRMPGFPEKLIAAAIQQLVRDKQLRKYSSFGREQFLLGREGHPHAYAVAAHDAVQAIVGKLAAAGGGPEEIRVALGISAAATPTAPALTVPASDLETEVLRAMEKIEPAHSAPVSVRELREALPHVDKHQLDEAARKLRANQKVFLSRHDFPQSLSETERDALIDGQDGHYYVAITARSE